MQVRGFDFSVQEFAGSVADLGVLVPLVILLVLQNGLNPTAVLFCAGLLFIASGLLFRVPIPVQPLKAVAIIAIASGLSPRVIAAAGILMGGLLLLLSLTGLANLLERLFTKPLVRGIQLGVGSLLVVNGVKMALDPHFLRGGERVVLALAGLELPVGLFFGIAAAALLIFSAGERIPAALVLLGFGVLSGFCFGSLEMLRRLSFSPVPLSLTLPGAADFGRAFFLLVIPQIPLTLGNSIVATADTARSYFGSEAARVTPTRLTLSLGVANVFCGVLGAAPLCHGAGGLTAHYRFGARSGAMGLMIGTLLALAGLLLGRSAVDLFSLLPPSILGAMLAFIGVEHALLIRDLLGSRRDLAVAVAIGSVAGVTGSIVAGCAIGALLVCLLKVLERVQGRRLRGRLLAVEAGKVDERR